MEGHKGEKRRFQTLLVSSLLILAPLGGCNEKNTVTGPTSQAAINSISPDHGCPGDRVTIRGTQLLQASFTIAQNGVTVGTGQISYRSSTVIFLILPNLSPGSYDIVANGDTGGAKSFTEDDCPFIGFPYLHVSPRR